MNRKKYKGLGIVLVVVAILQFLVLGCIVRKLTGAQWLETASEIVMCALLSGGIGMIFRARDDKSYKKSMIEENDERNKLLNLKACTVTLIVGFFCYVGVFVYMTSMGILSGAQLALFGIPVFVGTLAYVLSMIYFSKRI